MKNLLTLDAFIDWLEAQPPETEYEWMSLSGCLVATYLRANGFAPPWKGGANFESVLPSLDAYRIIGSGNIEGNPFLITDKTYGAALARAKQWRAEHPA